MLSPGWVNPHRYQVPTYIESKERLSPRERGVFLRCGIQKTFDHGIPIVRIPAKVKLGSN